MLYLTVENAKYPILFGRGYNDDRTCADNDEENKTIKSYWNLERTYIIYNQWYIQQRFIQTFNKNWREAQLNTNTYLDRHFRIKNTLYT